MTQIANSTEKKVIAKSTAEYRSVPIMETDKGVTIIIGSNRYDLADLNEATAFIDAMYANAARRVLEFPMRVQ
jgi:hypothetical protein